MHKPIFISLPKIIFDLSCIYAELEQVKARWMFLVLEVVEVSND